VGIDAFFIPFVKGAFNISTGMSYLIVTATFGSFVLFSVPAGGLINRTGYKGGIVTAFMVLALSFYLIIPAAKTGSFIVFLGALFVNGIGRVILNTSVNPYITLLGPKASAARRMSIMGIANKLSYAAASLILAFFMDLKNIDIMDTIAPFYVITGIFVALGIASYFIPLPELKAEGEDATSKVTEASSASNLKTSIWQFPHLILGSVSLFFYVGVETIALSTINDFAVTLDLSNPENYVWLTSFAMVFGYLAGVIFTPNVITQEKALTLSAVLGVILAITITIVPVYIAIYLVALLGFANAVMLPAIWPLALADLGKWTKKGSGLVVMGGIGGAIIPLIFGYVVELTSYHSAYLVCLPSYFFILYFAEKGHKIRI
jgi:MFS transporter, FHS family, L-fucose permease